MLKTWPKPKANRDSRLESPGSLLFKQPLWHFRVPGFAYPKVVPTGFFSRDFFHSWRTWDCRTGLRYRVCASKGSSNRWEGAPWVVTIALIDGYSHIYIFCPWNKSQSTCQHTYLPHTYIPTYLQPYIPAYLHADILTYLHTVRLSYMKVNQNPLYSLSLAPISPIPLTWQRINWGDRTYSQDKVMAYRMGGIFGHRIRRDFSAICVGKLRDGSSHEQDSRPHFVSSRKLLGGLST